MNREIKFRAIRTDNREFVKGNYAKTIIGNYDSETHQILPFGENVMSVFVDVSTLGQFTGLRDKNGKDIYEGDILAFPPHNDWEKENYSCFEVFFHDGDANSDYNIGYSMNRMHCHGAIEGGTTLGFKPKNTSKMIVIGNIHKNPELLNNK